MTTERDHGTTPQEAFSEQIRELVVRANSKRIDR
jgi:hypothetical protein